MNLLKKIMLALISCMSFSYDAMNAVRINVPTIYPHGFDFLTIHRYNALSSGPAGETALFEMQGPNGKHFVAIGVEDDRQVYSYISDANGRPLGGRLLSQLRPEEKLKVNVCNSLQLDHLNFEGVTQPDARWIQSLVEDGKTYSLRLTNPRAPKYLLNWEFILESDDGSADDFGSLTSDDDVSELGEEEEFDEGVESERRVGVQNSWARWV